MKHRIDAHRTNQSNQAIQRDSLEAGSCPKPVSGNEDPATSATIRVCEDNNIEDTEETMSLLCNTSSNVTKGSLHPMNPGNPNQTLPSNLPSDNQAALDRQTN